MTVRYHPDPGTVVICDFSGYRVPEIVKRRPVVVLSPRYRENLCTVVPLSTTPPGYAGKFHCKLYFDPPLPAPYNAEFCWVKGDMVSTVALRRLYLPFSRKAPDGKRIYDIRVISDVDMANIRRCVLHGLGLGNLTDHL